MLWSVLNYIIIFLYCVCAAMLNTYAVVPGLVMFGLLWVYPFIITTMVIWSCCRVMVSPVSYLCSQHVLLKVLFCMYGSMSVMSLPSGLTDPRDPHHVTPFPF